MMQIALGIDPEPLSMAPFTVATHEFPPARAAEFGVSVHPRASAYVFPSLGAYVGGDIVAGMLATGLTRDRRLRLFIDVGTNSEIALGSVDRVLATAAPAGPAFEAAQIKCGMRAADGAIEGLTVNDDGLELEVIGDVEPVGMCGSGLVDAVAELVHAGLLDHSGRFIPDEDAAERIPGAVRPADQDRRGAGVRPALAWRLGEDPSASVYLSQRDVRELQFAKGSIATGWHILLRELGVEADDISQVLLAGSFGAYLTPLSAVRIGLVPRIALPAHRVGRQRGRRGRQDRRAVAARARRGAVDPARGRVRRAVRSRRLQRPVHRPAGLPGMRHAPPARAAVVACGALAFDVRSIAHAVAGTSRSCPCRRCCTTAPSGSPPRSPRLWPATTSSASPTPTAAPTVALDEVLAGFGVQRLTGDHCYDVLGREEVQWALDEQPGTYFLTDFLARTFEHTVVRELGLDRWPELRHTYFAPLHPRAVAGPAPHGGDPPVRRGRGRAPGAAAGGPAGGQRRPGARARAVAHRLTRPSAPPATPGRVAR